MGDHYQSTSYLELYHAVISLSNLLNNKYKVNSGDRIAILSENRPEWVVSDMATLYLQTPNISIYPTLKASEVLEIFNSSKPVGAIVSTEAQYEKIMEIKVKCPFLEWIIVMDRQDLLKPTIAQEDEIAFDKAVSEIKRDTIASIVYTSGSTGLFKGVILSHGNFLSNIEDITASLQLDDKERVLSILPLSHTFERTAGYYLLISLGASIYYATDTTTISKDIQLSKPTVIICVPRIFEKMQNKIYSNLKGIKKLIFTWARYVHRTFKPNSLVFKIAQHLVYAKIKNNLGGQLRFCVCGGAPLSQELGVFFQELGITILEGYGLTETSPVISFNRLGSPRFGTVGQALPRVQVSLAQDGELRVKGPSVMRGYYENPLATKAAFSDDGWFLTGDIVEISEDGYIKIIDRKKEILVLSNGKKVAPLSIERDLRSSRYISQVVVIGENRNYLIALIVPNFELLGVFMCKENVVDTSPLAATKSDLVIHLYEEIIRKKMAKHAPYMQIKKFVLLENEFTQLEGELTPTLKIKRSVIRDKYAQVIEAMYQEDERSEL